MLVANGDRRSIERRQVREHLGCQRGQRSEHVFATSICVDEGCDLLARLAYFFISTSSPSAQARATRWPALSSPGILSQPPFSMKVLRW